MQTDFGRHGGFWQQSVFIALICLLAILLALSSAARIRDYRSGESIWRDTIQKAPANPRAWCNCALAVLHDNSNPDVAGRYAAAEPMLATAVELKPDYAAAHQALGSLLLKSDPDRSRRHLEEAVRLRPRNAPSRHALGTMLLRIDPIAAERHLAAAVDLDPRSTDSLVNLANLLLVRGETGRAVGLYRQALTVDPNHPLARHNLDAVQRRAAAEASP
jgi:tetratricopeptide (TPR) repeat protein